MKQKLIWFAGWVVFNALLVMVQAYSPTLGAILWIVSLNLITVCLMITISSFAKTLKEEEEKSKEHDDLRLELMVVKARLRLQDPRFRNFPYLNLQGRRKAVSALLGDEIANGRFRKEDAEYVLSQLTS